MKKLIIFTVINLFCLIVIGQNSHPFGFTIITQKKGTPLPESPQLNSERYKMYFSAEEFDLEYKLSFQEFSDGVYKKNERYLEVVSHRIMKKNETLVVEFIPELYNVDRQFKMFVNIPGFTTVRRKSVSDDTKCIKYVFFDLPEHTVINSSLPILLVYEDNKNTNETEHLLFKYIKENGRLINSEQMLDVIKLNIAQYNLLFYTTKKVENEN